MDRPTPAEIQFQKDHFYESQAHGIIVVSATCFALAAVAVFLRVLAGRLIHKPLNKDDYMIFAALVRLAFIAPSKKLKYSMVSKYPNRLTKSGREQSFTMGYVISQLLSESLCVI